VDDVQRAGGMLCVRGCVDVGSIDVLVVVEDSRCSCSAPLNLQV